MTKTEKKQIAESLRQKMMPLMGRMAVALTVTPAYSEAYSELLRMSDELYWELLGGGRSFWSLLQDWEMNHYRPTMRADIDPRYAVLADLYDFFQAFRGKDVTAFRG